jgi:hypothetical protein
MKVAQHEVLGLEFGHFQAASELICGVSFFTQRL